MNDSLPVWRHTVLELVLYVQRNVGFGTSVSVMSMEFVAHAADGDNALVTETLLNVLSGYILPCLGTAALNEH